MVWWRSRGAACLAMKPGLKKKTETPLGMIREVGRSRSYRKQKFPVWGQHKRSGMKENLQAVRVHWVPSQEARRDKAHLLWVSPAAERKISSNSYNCLFLQVPRAADSNDYTFVSGKNLSIWSTAKWFWGLWEQVATKQTPFSPRDDKQKIKEKNALSGHLATASLQQLDFFPSVDTIRGLIPTQKNKEK